MLRSSTGK